MYCPSTHKKWLAENSLGNFQESASRGRNVWCHSLLHWLTPLDPFGGWLVLPSKLIEARTSHSLIANVCPHFKVSNYFPDKEGQLGLTPHIYYQQLPCDQANLRSCTKFELPTLHISKKNRRSHSCSLIPVFDCDLDIKSSECQVGQSAQPVYNLFSSCESRSPQQHWRVKRRLEKNLLTLNPIGQSRTEHCGRLENTKTQKVQALRPRILTRFSIGTN